MPILVVSVLAFAGLLCGGCGQAPQEPLRVGLSAFPPYEQAFLAQELGYFKDAGVAIRLVEYDELHDARLAYERGDLDGVTLTLNEVLVARDGSSRDLRVVRMIDASEGADMVIAGAAVGSVSDLRGKRVAIELGGVSHFLFLRALQKAGMTRDDVALVGMPQHAHNRAMVTGDVAAAVSYPPYSLELLANPGNHVLFSSKDIPKEILDVYAFDAQVLKGRAKEVKAFFKALDRAWDFLQANRAEACRIMAQREQMSAEAFCKTLENGIVLFSPADQARYFGPGLPAHEVVDLVANTLREVNVISKRPEVGKCLSTL